MKIKIIRDGQLLDKLIWLFILLYLILVCILSADSWGSIVMFGCAIVAFGLFTIKTRGKVKLIFSFYHVWWLIFALFELASALWALSPEAAVTQAMTTIKLLICMSLMYLYYQEESDLWQAYNVIRYSGVCVSLYTILYLGIDLLTQMILSGKRIEVYFSNINVIGVLAAFSITITLYEVLFRKFNVMTLVTVIPCLLAVVASGTRKAVLIVLMGSCMLLYYRFKSKNILTTLLRFSVIAAFAFLILSSVLSLPFFSGLVGRMDSLISFFTQEGKVDASTLVRNQMIQIGFEKFLDVPLFGIGIGSSGEYLREMINFDSYFHNNFIELLCCGGIVGFVIYYSMFAYCLWTFYKHRNDSNPLIKLGLIMVIIYLAMDVARVSYYSKPTFFYTMVFFLHAKSLNSVGTNNQKGNYEIETITT